MSEGFVVRCRKEVCDVIDKYREGLTISEVIGLLMEIAMHTWSLSCKICKEKEQDAPLNCGITTGSSLTEQPQASSNSEHSEFHCDMCINSDERGICKRGGCDKGDKFSFK